MKNTTIILLLLISITYSYAQSTINGYEYWFNNDFANKTTTAVTPSQQLLINQQVSTTGLMEGINVFNFRSFDNFGKYSSVLSHFFYKTSTQESNPSPQIIAYEYWIDNDFNNATVVNTPIQQQVNINELISMSMLPNGVHHFNIRFKDNTNLWSSVLSHFFYKTQEQVVTQNMITAYRYWFDNDFANAIHQSLTPNQQINLIENLDLTQLAKGNHEIHFQFKDILGKWSVVIHDTIQKASLPIANFSYSSNLSCDSTIINFTNNSIDADIYSWDFGDGTNSSIANPTHVYYTPNTYQVSLTVTDTLLGKDSTIILPVIINSLHTSANISEIACKNYTAPDGQVYTTSGIKTAIIQNAAGCDSTITIDLTVNTIDTSITHIGETLTANSALAIYNWLDCDNGYSIIGETSQSFTATQNGSYAVEITQNNCVDTSSCFTITTIGILENSFSNNMIVFPNPTKGYIKINLRETLAEFNVVITDLSGKTIHQSWYKNTQEFGVNLTTVESGIYLLTINSGNKKATIRLEKN